MAPQKAKANPNDIGPLLQTLIQSTEKQSSIQERMVEAQEATVKLKEENAKKKISRLVGDFLKNVFTEDGENPRDEIPPIIKQMMKDTADTTAMNVD